MSSIDFSSRSDKKQPRSLQSWLTITAYSTTTPRRSSRRLCNRPKGTRKDIVLTGDANCDLLFKNPKSDALRSFCASVNAHQLIDRPTRVTMTSRSLLDVDFSSPSDKKQPRSLQSWLTITAYSTTTPRRRSRQLRNRPKGARKDIVLTACLPVSHARRCAKSDLRHAC